MASELPRAYFQVPGRAFLLRQEVLQLSDPQGQSWVLWRRGACSAQGEAGSSDSRSPGPSPSISDQGPLIQPSSHPSLPVMCPQLPETPEFRKEGVVFKGLWPQFPKSLEKSKVLNAMW